MRRRLAVLVLTCFAAPVARGQTVPLAPSSAPPPPAVSSSTVSTPPAGTNAGARASTETFGRGVVYRISGVEVRGNRKTEAGLILSELGIGAGDTLTLDDPRVQAAELRLLSLGYFLRVQLRLLPIREERGAVVLVVDVEERGTVVLNALYLGVSEATLLWGGLDVSETNFLGRGIALGSGIVGSTTPTVPEAEAGRAVTLRAAGPPRRGGLLLGGSFLYSRGSEFFQAFGREDEVDPQKWRALSARRLGGRLSVGGDLSRTARVFTEGRFEAIDVRLPAIRTRDLGGGQAEPIDFDVHEGASRLTSLTTTLDLDSRSDPVLPTHGRRLAVSLEAALPVLGSSYSFAKVVAQGSFYFPGARDHVIAFHGFAGAILGDAPYFDRFFVGDLNFLLPPRALGLNFATLPSRNFLGTNVASKRYEAFAARALLEYAVPLWRRRGFIYRGDAFAAFGIFGLGGLDDLRMRDGPLGQALPLDLTADLGVKLDTYIGIFSVSVANALGRIPF